MKDIGRLLLVFMLGMIVMWAPSQIKVHKSYPFTKEQAVQCIVGESAGESFWGKIAVAEGIRNRGKLKGVFGCTNPIVHNTPEKIWDDANHAWLISRFTNLVNGADHWESIDFKTPWWAEDMIVTAQIGKHIFYKDK
jgi:hypothetical protein